MNETNLTKKIRLDAAAHGIYLWRNNIGAVKTRTGMMRFGLANESSNLNKTLKSADLIGIKPVIITQEMVGQRVGVFMSREVKESNWKYSGTRAELAQQAWIDLINGLGGDASFTTGEL